PKNRAATLLVGQVVRDYISNSFGSEYRTGVYSLLSSLGFRYQKAKGFYPGRNGQAGGEAKADKKTLDECSVDLEAVVLFEDEFSLSNTVTLPHTCAFVGERREIPCKQVKRERVMGFGNVNPISRQFTASFAEKRNYHLFRKHLKKLLKAYLDKKKIIVYVDNVRHHKTKALKDFLSKHTKFEKRYLPPYSPCLNLVERVW
ncbi:MAG: IS630 family transposase, partial [Prevotellaceae bacterium]|nr:IS630 family transposase [Prevotellaceae bacterium]